MFAFVLYSHNISLNIVKNTSENSSILDFNIFHILICFQHYLKGYFKTERFTYFHLSVATVTIILIYVMYGSLINGQLFQ